MGALIIPGKGKILQVVTFSTGALATGTVVIPLDDTIPQQTEGDQYLSLAITPISATSTLEIDVTVNAGHSAGTRFASALFRDATADAIAVTEVTLAAADYEAMTGFKHIANAVSVSSTTFKVRAGGNVAGTTTFNGRAAARLYGGSLSSRITIKEIAA